MNILYLTHLLPYPPTTGAVQRTHHLLRQTALRHKVWLVAFNQKDYIADEKGVAASAQALREICQEVHVVPLSSDISRFARIFLALRTIYTSRSYTEARFTSPQFDRAIHDILGRVKIDCIHVDTVALARTIPSTGIPAVLNHHNVESALLFRRAKATMTNPLLALYTLLEALKLRALERLTVPRFRYNLMVSAEDMKILENIVPHARAAVIANGTDTNYFKPQPVTNPHALVFAGTMRYLPNRDAMLWFATHIFPLIRKELPSVILDVVGPGAPPHLAAINPGIKVRGFVPDARAVIGPAALYIVPLRVGGGTRMKILDAFAMGKAVISTTIGAEGIATENGGNIVIGDGEAGFADAVVRVLKNPALAALMGDQARETAERLYSWDVIGPVLCGVYEKAVSSKT